MMQGAREFAGMFRTGQYGRLYLVAGSHARGRTFHIYVLPEGATAKENGPNNSPLNADAVEVYGIVGGQPGWTELYGWKREGKWCDDFKKLIAQRQAEIATAAAKDEARLAERKQSEAERVAALLSTY